AACVTDVSTVFFFFKQKTAYEIETRLEFRRVLFRSPATVTKNVSARFTRVGLYSGMTLTEDGCSTVWVNGLALLSLAEKSALPQIGRASCRERVEVTVVGVVVKERRREGVGRVTARH